MWIPWVTANVNKQYFLVRALVLVSLCKNSATQFFIIRLQKHAIMLISLCKSFFFNLFSWKLKLCSVNKIDLRHSYRCDHNYSMIWTNWNLLLLRLYACELIHWSYTTVESGSVWYLFYALSMVGLKWAVFSVFIACREKKHDFHTRPKQYWKALFLPCSFSGGKIPFKNNQNVGQ